MSDVDQTYKDMLRCTANAEQNPRVHFVGLTAGGAPKKRSECANRRLVQLKQFGVRSSCS
jgi:hypothetical protein